MIDEHDKLTHFNANGEAHMVDVSAKQPSDREAIASGEIRMDPATLARIVEGTHKKGDVLGIARIAGIMAAKKTSDLIPLCHPIMLTKVSVEFDIDANRSAVSVRATTATHERTGVEMEALSAVSASLLTIYDMCKAMDRGMVIEAVQLERKTGGKSGHWQRQALSSDAD